MEEPFIGQVTIYSFNWAPHGWALCDGAQMQISQNQALNALIGSLYGGDSKTFFNLPDLRGRTIVGGGGVSPISGKTYSVGNSGGQASFTLKDNHLPAHTHAVYASTKAPTALSPNGNVFATLPTTGSPPISGIYTSTAQTTGLMAPATVATAGANAAVNNNQPSLGINFCIALAGVYPPRQ